MFFLNRFSVSSNLFCASFLVTPCLVVTVQRCMEWIPIKKKNQRTTKGAYLLFVGISNYQKEKGVFLSLYYL